MIFISKIINFLNKLDSKKITNLTKHEFLKNFIVGHPLYQDYFYLKKELPEYLDKLDLNANWTDSYGYYKIIKDNFCTLCKNVNGSYYILGEWKFKNDGSLDFYRYSDDAKFALADFYIVRNKELYRGSVPNECFNFEYKRKFNDISDYFLYRKDGFELEVHKSNYDFLHKFELKNKNNYIYLSIQKQGFVFYIIKNGEEVFKIDSILKKTYDNLNLFELNKNLYNKFDEICKRLIKKEYLLDVYIDIFNLFINICNTLEQEL